MADDTIVETERLRLRNWREDDKRRFYDIMNRPSVMEHLGGVQSFEQWGRAHDRLLSYARDHGITFWVVERREDAAMLGFCGLKRCNSPGAGRLEGALEIGWRLREEAWGQGYAKEAAIATIDHGFATLGDDRIVALTVAENRPSWGLMERLGMARRRDLDFSGAFSAGAPLDLDLIVHSIARRDWANARERALAPK